VIEILVSEPKKVGDGMNAYVVYKVTTRVQAIDNFLKEMFDEILCLKPIHLL